MYLPKGYKFLEPTEPLQIGDFIVFYFRSLQVSEILKIGKQGRAYTTGGKWFPSVFTGSRPKFILKNTFRLRKIDACAPKIYEQAVFRFERKKTIDSKMSTGVREFLASKNEDVQDMFECSEELDNRIENPFISEQNRYFNIKSILFSIKELQGKLAHEKYCPVCYI